MSLLQDLGKGFALGLSIAVPVGPIGLLCIRRSINEGPAAGFAAGMGAAVADLVYALLAASGLAAFATRWQWLQPVGAALLFWIALQTWRSARPQETNRVAARASPLSAFATTFVLTILNPMTILSFAAMLAALGAADPRLLVPGVFLGSALWWLTLSAAASRLRPWLAGPRVIWLNRSAALMLAALAIMSL